MNNYRDIVSGFKSKKILVIGDLVLDQYIRGSVTRISPEAPVPVVLQKESFYTPGGASNVANNLASLGVDVTLVGKIGNDLEGKVLKAELKKRGINIDGLFVDKKNPTPFKTRIIAQHQQVVRVDRENVEVDDKGRIQKKISDFISKNIPHNDGIIISDYGKGLITPELVELICSRAIENKKIITVDPKDDHFSYYSKVTAITPNRKEAENAIRNIKITGIDGGKLGVHCDRLDSNEAIDRAGQELLKFLDLESLLVTLGESGMRLFEKGAEPFSIHTKAQEVFDVSGAGDTVISVFTAALAAGASKREAAEIANYSAGIVVGKMGAVAIEPEELIAAVSCSEEI